MPSEAVVCQTIGQAVRGYSAYQTTAMRQAARQDSLSWPVQVGRAYRQAMQGEITAGRVVCMPEDPDFLLNRWLPSRVAELDELLDWLVWTFGAQRARLLFLAHLQPTRVARPLLGAR